MKKFVLTICVVIILYGDSLILWKDWDKNNYRGS